VPTSTIRRLHLASRTRRETFFVLIPEHPD
jgi:hypothetical protein